MLIDKVKEKINKESITNKSIDLLNRLNDVTKAQKIINKTMDVTGDSARLVKNKMYVCKDKLGNYTQEKPFKSLLISAGLGMVVYHCIKKYKRG